MQKRENPAGVPGFKKRIAGKKNTTSDPLVEQGFCVACAYFRAIPLEFRRVRRVCALTGEKLPLAGNPLCAFQLLQEVVA